MSTIGNPARNPRSIASLRPFLHRRNVFLRNDTALDVVDEFEMIFAVDIVLDLRTFDRSASSGFILIFT